VALSLILNTFGITWGLPYHLSWSIDDISPWKPLALPWYWLHGAHKYPYLHWFVSLVFYAPVLAWWALTGRLDPGCLPVILHDEGCFADPYGQPGALMLISRLLSAAMGAGTVLAVHFVALELRAERAAALAAALVVAVSYVFVTYAHVGNLEVPQCFWFAVSMLFLARVLRRGGRRDYLGFGLAAGSTLATKEGVIGAYVLTCLLIYAVHLRRSLAGRPPGPRALLAASLDRKLLLLAGSLLLVYAASQNVLLNAPGFAEHWKEWIPSGEHMVKYGDRFGGYRWLFQDLVRSLHRSMGVPLAALCAIGVPYACVRRPWTAVLLAPGLSYLVFSIMLAKFAPERFVMPLVLLLAVPGGVLAARLLRVRGVLRPVALALVAAAFGHGFLYALSGDLAMRNDSRYAAEDWLRAHVPASARIASCSNPIDLPRLDRLGYQTAFFPRDDAGQRALQAWRPEYVIVSAASPGWFPLHKNRGLRPEEAGALGYRAVWEAGGATGLGRWFRSPFPWVSPQIVVLVPADGGARTGSEPAGAP